MERKTGKDAGGGKRRGEVKRLAFEAGDDTKVAHARIITGSGIRKA
ncbi:hypothetical protein [uncultured Akkermansia sp.]|nr:hypothetical protein [uncultured Akkermansia sp.]